MRRRNLWVMVALALCAATTQRAAAQGTIATEDSVRIFISLEDRRLDVVDASGDTLYSAPAAVGSGRTLRNGLRAWRFRTPVGVTRVVTMEAEPVWIPPDWHYVELARKLKANLKQLHTGDTIPLSGDRALVVRGAQVGIRGRDASFSALPRDEEIFFEGTLYVPPFGTLNRVVEGELGPYRLNLANGVGIHGTPYKDSIGKAITHGCIRLHDADITWLYEHVPVGTRVIIY
jgi:lipoprotein-anchoring transpeptidase ErfK/SrfK